MANPNTTGYPIHDLIARRWSPRAFSNRSVDPDTLRTLFEAARWAPSSYNEQPWHFIVATKESQDDQFNRMLSCLVAGNIKWAQSAPVLILSVTKLQFDQKDKVNRHALHDVGLAVENLIVQATAMNLYVHQMAGFDMEQAREIFEIPEDYEPVTMIALGYLGEAAKAKERTRKPCSEFVFADKFGKPSPLFT